MKKGFNFARAFKGKLCTGVVESVPVGIYAKEALTRLGWWQSIQRRVVGTEDVRAALNLVERGECDAGIVYETDAKQSKKVEVIGRFPADTHAPIVYPFALVTQSGDAKKFLDYLKQEPAAEVFARYGFKLLEQ
jgi:molybdate transport system substrate-binding protein